MARTALDLILVGYRLADTKKAIAFCNALCNDAFDGRRVLVLNRPDLVEPLRNFSVGWETVLGSNELGEFSGWQEGLTHLGNRPCLTAFVNDTVNTHRWFSAFRRRAFLASVKGLTGAHLLGFIDRAWGRFEVSGQPLGAWISTYCFVATPQALERLEHRLTDPEIVDACVPGGESESAFFARLSPDLVTHLRQILFGGIWYASAPLTSQNAKAFQFKARCVVAEKLLAARCVTLGITLTDAFELHPRLQRSEKLYERLRGAVRKSIRRVRRPSLSR